MSKNPLDSPAIGHHYACVGCGNTDVTIETFTYWDADSQAFVTDDIADKGHVCSECGQDTAVWRVPYLAGSAAIRFANYVLSILAARSEWEASTLDDIANKACYLGLATTHDGLFATLPLDEN